MSDPTEIIEMLPTYRDLEEGGLIIKPPPSYRMIDLTQPPTAFPRVSSEPPAVTFKDTLAFFLYMLLLFSIISIVCLVIIAIVSQISGS
jgi:hypothetical protein